MTAFRSGFPITLTSFVNRTGSIGLSLLPMILIDLHTDSARAALVMGTVKAALVVGSLLGGWASDRFDVRLVYLVSFGLPAIGLGVMPLTHYVWVIAFGAILAQLGNTFYNPTARLLILRLIKASEQQEALGWLRTGNNAGLVVSSLIGMCLASLGTGVLILFDSFTSFVALLLGRKLIPQIDVDKHEPATPSDSSPSSEWRLFLSLCSLLCIFGFIYELFMVGISAKLRIIFGAEGLRIFSAILAANTILCTLLSVPASKYIRRADIALPAGLILLLTGAAIGLYHPERLLFVFIGLLLLTVGEIVFNSLSLFLLMKFTPQGRRQGTLFGSASTLISIARMVAASLAFPLVVYGQNPALVFLIGIIPLLLLLLKLKRSNLMPAESAS
jgi:MFS family permease